MGKLSDVKVYDKTLYKLDDKNTKLMEGMYYNRHFVVLRHKSGHPNAYLEVLDDDWIKTVEPTDYAKEHGWDDRYDAFSGYINGGATYYGEAYWDAEDKRTYIGWDYGHCDDYDPWWSQVSGKEDTGHKWNFVEIMMDVAHAYDAFERDNIEHLLDTHPETKTE